MQEAFLVQHRPQAVYFCVANTAALTFYSTALDARKCPLSSTPRSSPHKHPLPSLPSWHVEQRFRYQHRNVSVPTVHYRFAASNFVQPAASSLHLMRLAAPNYRCAIIRLSLLLASDESPSTSLARNMAYLSIPMRVSINHVQLNISHYRRSRPSLLSTCHHIRCRLRRFDP